MSHNHNLYPQQNEGRFLVPFLLGAAVAYPLYSLKNNCVTPNCVMGVNNIYNLPNGYYPYTAMPYNYYPMYNNYPYFNNYPMYREEEGLRLFNLPPSSSLSTPYNIARRFLNNFLPFNPVYCIDSPFCYYHGSPYYQKLLN